MASQPTLPDPIDPGGPIDDPVPMPIDPIPPTPSDPVVTGGSDYPGAAGDPLTEGP